MRVTIEKIYNGIKAPVLVSAVQEACVAKVRSHAMLGLTGVYRCACDYAGMPLGSLYCGPSATNPEFVITVEREEGR